MDRGSGLMLRIKCFHIIILAATFLMAGPSLGVSAQQAAGSGGASRDGLSALPQEQGRELLVKQCTTCHDLQPIATQRKSTPEWRRTVQDMIDRGAPVLEDDAKAIVDYLVRHLGRVDQEAPRTSSASTATIETQGTVSKADANLPTDIDPDTRNRLPQVQRQALDEFGQKLFDKYQGEGERSGPREIRLHSPRVAEYMTLGNQYLRYTTGIDFRLMELVTLLAARATDQQYEWVGHEMIAVKAGLSQEIIDVVKYNKPVPSTFDERDSTLIALCREVLKENKVSSETFARALKLFGAKGLVDIVSHLGHKVATAILLNAFDQRLRPGQQPLLPIPVP